MTPRVLVVDDEERMRDLLSLHLEKVFRVQTASTGEEALKLMSETSYDLVILDVLMPGMDGWEVCAAIRESYNVPVMMLTALSSVDEKLEAFTAGADDYMVKPFDARELIARAKALIRRGGADQPQDEILTFPGLVIDPVRRTVRAEGNEIHVTPMEFDLLYHIAREPGRVFSRNDLLKNVWQDEGYVETRTVDSHIKTLRGKLGRDGMGRTLVTVWGTGYKFEVPEEMKSPGNEET